MNGLLKALKNQWNEEIATFKKHYRILIPGFFVMVAIMSIFKILNGGW
tara:strand:+ start:1201 stop:1344 length:144 start_codon:yes stop_codon:yes gene_type:complete